LLLNQSLHGNHSLHIVEQLPLQSTLAVLKEIKEDHFIELKTLGFIDGQAKHLLHERRHASLALLVSDDDHAVAAELLLLHFFAVVFVLGL